MVNPSRFHVPAHWLPAALIGGMGLFLAFAGIAAGFRQELLLLGAFGGLVLLAVRLPVVTVGVFVLTSTPPFLFVMTPLGSLGDLAVGGGLRMVDLVLLAMLTAIAVRLVQQGELAQQVQTRTGMLIVCFGLWLAFEVVRNWGIYGLSAPGEFRFRYLVLAAPLYVAVALPDPAQRRQVFKLLLAAALGVTLLAIPVIGVLKGWGIGPADRFLPSNLSLALVYGLTGAFLARKYDLLSLPLPPLLAAGGVVAVLILVDSHRSVWIAAAALLLTLLLLGEIRVPRLALLAPWLGLLMVIAVAVGGNGSTQIDLNELVTERAAEIFDPLAQEGTGAWRLRQWEIQIQNFYAQPVAGIGFGGYWGEAGVSPHSLYVQTLVKLGAVGMLLYAAIVLAVLVALWRWLRAHHTAPPPETAIVVLSFVTLISAHVYYTVYAFEGYAWLFIALGMAVVQGAAAPQPVADALPAPELPEGLEQLV